MSNARTVSTDALETLGTIINDKQKRDAIHIAVLPVIAGTKLHPGDDITIIDNEAVRSDKSTGIVDPFLKKPVQVGERFWMLLYPRMVTSLRHVWSHPAFSDTEDGVASSKQISQTQLDKYAVLAGIDTSYLIEAATDYVEHNEYLCDGGRWEGFSLPDDFWDHYEIVTGKKVPKNDRGSFFSCSC